MRQVDLVLATGGAAMVKSAYSSGTPSYGVGAGNPVIIVAEDAELSDAAEKIRISKSFDNATSCSSDNSLLIQAGVFDRMVDELKKQGGHLCSPEEKVKLEKWMCVANPKTGEVGLNPKVVAISARRIAADAGIGVPDTTRFLMVVGERPGEERFSGEKISPVLALWRYGTIDEAIGLIEKLHTYAGMGHSVGIYSSNRDYIHKVALAAKVSRILVRQAHAPSAGGHFHNGMPSTVTLGCGTWGGNITTENIHWKHFINVTWVSEPLPVSKPTEDEIWGPVWSKYGK
jgi:sulfoacetaldehyde dehydrogenase